MFLGSLFIFFPFICICSAVSFVTYLNLCVYFFFYFSGPFYFQSLNILSIFSSFFFLSSSSCLCCMELTAYCQGRNSEVPGRRYSTYQLCSKQNLFSTVVQVLINYCNFGEVGGRTSECYLIPYQQRISNDYCTLLGINIA